MEQADLIWHNGELVAWEDAKVHVLTHGLHYGTGCSRASAPTRRRTGPSIFRHRDHLARLFKSAELYYMPIPYTLEELRTATHELIAANDLRECYIRPIVFRGYGQMGLYPLDCEVSVSIAVWPWGAYLGEDGKLDGRPRQGLELAADLRRLADPARQGQRPVPQQRAGQDRGLQGRLPGGDPARRPRVRVRGLGREHLRRPRRRDPHPAADGRDPRRHQPQVDHHDRPRPRLRGGRARPRPRRAVPGRRGVPVRHGRRAGPGARDRRPPDRRRAAPGRSPGRSSACSTTRCTAAIPATRTGSTSSRCRRAPPRADRDDRASSSTTRPCATACRARACRCRRARSCASPTGSTSSGIDLIEAGFPSSNPKELELFGLLGARDASATPRSPPSA